MSNTRHTVYLGREAQEALEIIVEVKIVNSDNE